LGALLVVFLFSLAVLTIPLVKLQDVLLCHLKEVSSALRVEPAPIRTGIFVLTHDEVASERVELTSALTEPFYVFTLMGLFLNCSVFVNRLCNSCLANVTLLGS